jgi:hypothetical protein
LLAGSSAGRLQNGKCKRSHFPNQTVCVRLIRVKKKKKKEEEGYDRGRRANKFCFRNKTREEQKEQGGNLAGLR